VIVVADTSVILNLCCVQHERLLQTLFGRVLIPTEVASEFRRLAGAQTRFSGLPLPGWIEILTAPPPPPAVSAANLDLGEAAAIALCLNQEADALLVDESLGRAVATRLGLRTIGILGILLEARARGLIPRIATVLDRLEQEAGFWIAPALRVRVIRLAQE
jgi:uncharacterized protein